jgi:hypothetical protein
VSRSSGGAYWRRPDVVARAGANRRDAPNPGDPVVLLQPEQHAISGTTYPTSGITVATLTGDRKQVVLASGVGARRPGSYADWVASRVAVQSLAPAT